MQLAIPATTKMRNCSVVPCRCLPVRQAQGSESVEEQAILPRSALLIATNQKVSLPSESGD